MEKPVVFTHEDILSSTDGFSDSNLLGHGAYGSVYYGLLRDQVYSFQSTAIAISRVDKLSFSDHTKSCIHIQEVAIKRMTATKTKEVLAEMKVLCKVHHTNLVKAV